MFYAVPGGLKSNNHGLISCSTDALSTLYSFRGLQSSREWSCSLLHRDPFHWISTYQESSAGKGRHCFHQQAFWWRGTFPGILSLLAKFCYCSCLDVLYHQPSCSELNTVLFHLYTWNWTLNVYNNCRRIRCWKQHTLSTSTMKDIGKLENSTKTVENLTSKRFCKSLIFQCPDIVHCCNFKVTEERFMFQEDDFYVDALEYRSSGEGSFHAYIIAPTVLEHCCLQGSWPKDMV